MYHLECLFLFNKNKKQKNDDIIYISSFSENMIGLRKLCTPAYIYLVISMFSIIIIMLQNTSNSNTYCMGYYTCQVPNIFLIFAIKLIYVLFWTWILNLICKAGLPGVSWALLLFPYILMFIFIVIFMMSSAGDIPVLM